MKRILITTDFSSHSKHTIQYVINLLQETKIPCRLHLINTYVVQQTDPSKVIQANDEMKQKSKAGLEAEQGEALKLISNPNITIETSTHFGSLNNVIMHLLKKENIDLVAMGKNGGKHVEMVSTLLKQQECPLLITYLKE